MDQSGRCGIVSPSSRPRWTARTRLLVPNFSRTSSSTASTSGSTPPRMMERQGQLDVVVVEVGDAEADHDEPGRDDGADRGHRPSAPPRDAPRRLSTAVPVVACGAEIIRHPRLRGSDSEADGCRPLADRRVPGGRRRAAPHGTARRRSSPRRDHRARTLPLQASIEPPESASAAIRSSPLAGMSRSPRSDITTERIRPVEHQRPTTVRLTPSTRATSDGLSHPRWVLSVVSVMAPWCGGGRSARNHHSGAAGK